MIMEKMRKEAVIPHYYPNTCLEGVGKREINHDNCAPKCYSNPEHP